MRSGVRLRKQFQNGAYILTISCLVHFCLSVGLLGHSKQSSQTLFHRAKIGMNLISSTCLLDEACLRKKKNQ